MGSHTIRMNNFWRYLTSLAYPWRGQATVSKVFQKIPWHQSYHWCNWVFIEKPIFPCGQKATWSDYKHHNTLKLLVRIAASGAFTFISKLRSGSTSDWKIVQESGLIDLLEKGDHLMADRGFNIRDLLTRRGVKLNIPPFSKSRFAYSTYHTSKKAKEELTLLTNPEPLSPPRYKPLPCLHFQQQMCTITCSTFLSYCHYFNFLHLSFFVVVVSQGNSCLEKEVQQHQALPKSEYTLNVQSKDWKTSESSKAICHSQWWK